MYVTRPALTQLLADSVTVERKRSVAVSVTVERKRSYEIATLLKKYAVKNSSSEKVAAIEGKIF